MPYPGLILLLGDAMNLRDRKKLQTREALAEAAQALFQEVGFDQTTIDHIVDRAGVSRRTFFRYFSTKEAAYFAEVEDRLSVFRSALDTVTSPGAAWDTITTTLLAAAVRYQADSDRALRFHATLRASPLLQSYHLRLDEGWEGAARDTLVRVGCEPLDAAIRAGALMGVVRAALSAWFTSGGRADLASTGHVALRALEHGIGAPLASSARAA